MPKKKTLSVFCPTCAGAMVVPGDRYTEPAKPCPTCSGAGTVADEDDGA